MSVVLMYHALYRDDDTSAIDQEDLPYAVSEENFIRQLDSLQGKRVGLFDQSEEPDVVITFDDGHLSNLEIAAPLLVERGLPAIFFVTSEFIGKRPGFMDSVQLAALAAMPGMSVGSHGVTHRFLDDLDENELREELLESRQQLERMTTRECRSISFPGGRYNDNTLNLLKDTGYWQWYGSEIGIVEHIRSFVQDDARTEDDRQLLVQNRRQPIERVAIRRSTTLEEFARMIGPDETYYTDHRRRSQAKALLRRVLGNRLYHGLYKSLSVR
ncbi:polysaccharide deacetylase family protein [Granulosicoccus sp. 3-233]|uniref:polysaccharide deacetylase family protein n=1 Tax=Granulosicoccus sp. 3-233 TaxID=3417969 RepID=UPI003D343DBB